MAINKRLRNPRQERIDVGADFDGGSVIYLEAWINAGAHPEKRAYADDRGRRCGRAAWLEMAQRKLMALMSGLE